MRLSIYLPDLPSDSDIGPLRDLLRSYSKIATGDVDSHIRRVRETAWDLTHDAFVGRWRFLCSGWRDDPCHGRVVARLSRPRSRDVLLDLGCGVGIILRKLRAAGVPGSRLIGTDIQPRFIDLGYDLFRDRKLLGASFVVGDMKDPKDKRLAKLSGKVTIIYAGKFFHLFSWAEQLYIGQRLMSFIKPDTANGLIYGMLIGVVRAAAPTATKASMPYFHDPDSFQRLWDEIGESTGTRWRVKMEQSEQPAALLKRIAGDHFCPMRFEVEQDGAAATSIV
ncbi:hypothetical protein CDD82_112 [Ophiocordyceps australis]|uniref:Methyltransferase domain-containing protein n=1 Tax=Ophiocordyceps australis TaxID=1399860 RepID=A0A2C5ZQL9_9HYPO|nr:hypothetical protein CDD82_112 [Ophiocordyceps australis]